MAKSLWHHGRVWQCPNCGSQKVRITQAHAYRHSLQRSRIHLKKVQMLFTVFSKKHQKYLQVPFADYGSLALYMHSLVCSIRYSTTKFALSLGLWGGSSQEFGHISTLCCSDLWFQQRLFEWLAHRMFLPCQFFSCIRAAVWLFPQVVVTAHLSVWI